MVITIANTPSLNASILFLVIILLFLRGQHRTRATNDIRIQTGVLLTYMVGATFLTEANG